MFGSFISAKCESLLTQIESFVRVRKGPWSRRVQAGEVKLSALLLCWSVSKMCISFWHSNLPYFKKSISVDNECKCQILTLEYIYIYIYIYTHTLDSHHCLRRLELYKHSTGTLPELSLQQPILTRSHRMTTTPLTINQSDTRRD